MSSPTRFSSSRSSPKILIATCERTPVTISSTRCAMGWCMIRLMPGRSLSFSRICSSNVACVQPSGQSARGLSDTTGSDSVCGAGSAGDSPRPTLLTTIATPGTVMIRFEASISSLNTSSNDMFGARVMAGVIEFSFSVGMNDLPSSGKRHTDPTSSATEIPMVFFSLRSAASRSPT